MLRQILENLKSRWKLRILITLSDKDWSEINALVGAFPDAKHQLCLWHALRAVKRRLAILRRMPAHYDVASAKHEFDFIDMAFVPVAQQTGVMVSMII